MKFIFKILAFKKFWFYFHSLTFRFTVIDSGINEQHFCNPHLKHSRSMAKSGNIENILFPGRCIGQKLNIILNVKEFQVKELQVINTLIKQKVFV